MPELTRVPRDRTELDQHTPPTTGASNAVFCRASAVFCRIQCTDFAALAYGFCRIGMHGFCRANARFLLG